MTPFDLMYDDDTKIYSIGPNSEQVILFSKWPNGTDIQVELFKQIDNPPFQNQSYDNEKAAVHWSFAAFIF